VTDIAALIAALAPLKLTGAAQTAP